jgi:putative flippase GtrA
MKFPFQLYIDLSRDKKTHLICNFASTIHIWDESFTKCYLKLHASDCATIELASCLSFFATGTYTCNQNCDERILFPSFLLYYLSILLCSTQFLIILYLLSLLLLLLSSISGDRKSELANLLCMAMELACNHTAITRDMAICVNKDAPTTN